MRGYGLGVCVRVSVRLTVTSGGRQARSIASEIDRFYVCWLASIHLLSAM